MVDLELMRGPQGQLCRVYDRYLDETGSYQVSKRYWSKVRDWEVYDPPSGAHICYCRCRWSARLIAWLGRELFKSCRWAADERVEWDDVADQFAATAVWTADSGWLEGTGASK